MARVISPATTAAITSTSSTPAYGPSTGPADIGEGTTRTQNGFADFTSKIHLILPSQGLPRKGILAIHGANNDGYDFVSATSAWGTMPLDLADMLGYAIVSMDTGFRSQGNPLALAAVTAAYNYLTNTVLGVTGAKVGVIGSSMGSRNSLLWCRANASKVFGVALGPTYADSQVRHTIGYQRQWNVPTDAPNAALWPQLAPGMPGTTDTHYLDYAYLVPTPGYLGGPDPYDTSVWQTNFVNPGWGDVEMHPEYWANLGFPIRIWHAEQDEGIPYQVSEWWVGAVGSANVTKRANITRSGAKHTINTWGTMNSTQTAPSGLSDAAILASGGMPRYEMRDFFLSCEALL